MATKRQHYVPKVYMKAWETKVETFKEPDKKFNGIYVIKDGKIGEGANRNSVLWKPHLYTINFRYSFIFNSCSKVKSEFVDMIYNLLRNGFKQPVYGKVGYSIIKTKNSIRKHLCEICDWEFYYDDGNLARKIAILNKIEELNCYILEDSFDNYFENNWEGILNAYIEGVNNGYSLGAMKNEIIISEKVAKEMLSCFFIMLCRNPKFDAMGVYTQIKHTLLYPFFDSISEGDAKVDDLVFNTNDGRKHADELMTGIWYSELYKIFFKGAGGFYHNIVQSALSGCNMVLIEACDDTCKFITSDNPAFEHKSPVVERNNRSGFYFPISPKYLIFLTKGNKDVNYICYQKANSKNIKTFNKIINLNKMEFIIASSKDLNDLI